MGERRWERPPPEVTVADQLNAKHGVVCPDCLIQFDPFEARDHDGVPPHDCDGLATEETRR